MMDPRQPDFGSTPISPGRPRFDYAPSAAAPVVSIVTPFFNPDPQDFAQTAQAVMGQSLQAFEWIIVNDGSTEPGSLAALDSWRSRDPRVRVIDQPANAGPGAARNRGFAAARCEFVFQLDADDLIEPTTIEKCAWYLTSHPEHALVKGFTVAFGAKRHLWQRGFHDGARFLKENLATITAMIRRSAFFDAGGYDESITGGMEDWDFWLRCARAGHWGGTIPEFLDWYRRRDDHSEAWNDWDGGDRQSGFARAVRDRYPQLSSPGGFPRPTPPWAMPCSPIRRESPIANPLRKSARRLLMVLPWMRMGGADKFNRDLIEQLTRRGWEVTIATTSAGPNGWMAEFARLTPDVFVLDHLVRPIDQPVMLRGLIESRRPDVVMVSNSEAGYLLLPYLRAVCPEPAYIDYNHMEEEYWRSGGHPRSGAGLSDQLELNIAASRHLRDWMVSRGGDPDRTQVATINVDPVQWQPDGALRATVRTRLGISADTPVILYAGRICRQKQPKVFTRAMRELDRRARAAGVEFVTLVAGDGEDRASLEQELREFKLTARVRMLGEVSSDDMRELMSASDLFFLPSRWEGIALVFYEAMASGVVIVGADVGGQKELVTPDTGVLLPKGRPGHEIEDEPGPFAEALLGLLVDADRRREMGRRARQRIIEHFTIDAMGARMDALLSRAIELRRTTPRPTVPVGLAHEMADRAVETLRLTRSADRLWTEVKALRERTARDSQPSERAPSRPVAPAPRARPRRGKARRAATAGGNAQRELALIESSRAWRIVMRMKRTHAYGLLARLRYGPGWRDAIDRGTPEQRLARIKASRAFRLITRAKASRVYKVIGPRPRPAPTVELKPQLSTLNGHAPAVASAPAPSSAQNGHAPGPRPRAEAPRASTRA
ncbi:MAG: glycosyltransferase [Phycisphaeraceae bacterium]|nr:glycosyltransferase [Phycisphaeraceae bacterium]